MQEEYKNGIRPSTWIFISIAIIFVVGFFGYQIFNNFQQQKAKEQKENEKIEKAYLEQKNIDNQEAKRLLLQKQCEIITKSSFESFIALVKENDQKKGWSSNYDYVSHYNNSMSECFSSVHVSTFINNLGSTTDTFILQDEDNKVIAKLGYSTFMNSKTIVLCVVNGQPCSSIEEYTKLTTPYLNN